MRKQRREKEKLEKQEQLTIKIGLVLAILAIIEKLLELLIKLLND